MKESRTLTGIFALAALAALGALLVYVPPLVVEQYERVKALESPTAIYGYFAAVGTGAALLVGVMGYVLWRIYSATRRKQRRRDERSRPPSRMSAQQREAEINQNLGEQADIVSAAKRLSPEERAALTAQAERLEHKLSAQKLEIVAFGTISSGKSSLLNALAGRDVFNTDPKGGTTIRRNEIAWQGGKNVALVDTPGLGEIHGADHVALAREAALHADLVLFVVDGALRDDEHRVLSQLAPLEKRILVCLNKSDIFDPRARETLLGQIAEQVRGMVEPADIVAVRSRPVMRVRQRVLAAGDEVAEEVEELPDISALSRRMSEVIARDGRDLLLANLLLRSRGLVEDARNQVQAALDREAWDIINFYTWNAGGAAAVVPFPIVDVVAGLAISSKMVLDLARVYQQPIDSKAAVNLLGQLGKNLLAILGTQAVLPAVVAGVAQLLKSLPGIGLFAGATLQGLVQALVTRWIGLVFMDYFRQEMTEPEGGLTGLARRKWQELTAPAELSKFMAAAREKLLGQAKND